MASGSMPNIRPTCAPGKPFYVYALNRLGHPHHPLRPRTDQNSLNHQHLQRQQRVQQHEQRRCSGGGLVFASASGVVETPPAPSAATLEYKWSHQGMNFSIPYDVVGDGQQEQLLLLPSISSVSIRSEMRPLAEKFAAGGFRCFIPDWPGFGSATRPPIDYRPPLLQKFLADFVGDTFESPVGVIATGHAAGYALDLGSSKQPGPWSRAVLVAPTWMGPLSVMGASDGTKSFARWLLRFDLTGPPLYGMITSTKSIKSNYQSHVFTRDELLTDAFVEDRRNVATSENGRYSSSAFITGALDVIGSREELIAKAQGLGVPVMVVVGMDSPKRSKAEMVALAQADKVVEKQAPGALGMHEEFAQQLGDALMPFLSGGVTA